MTRIRIRIAFARGAVAAVCVAAALSGCNRDPQLQAHDRTQETLSRDDQRRFSELTIRQIMQGPGIVGTTPTRARFSADGGTVFFSWNSPARLDSLNRINPLDAWTHWKALEKEAGTWALDVLSGGIRALPDGAADSIAPDDAAWNRARRRRVEIRGGDVFLVDATHGTSRRVTDTIAREHSPSLSPSADVAWFVRDNNLFSVAFDGGPVRQRTQLVLADAPEQSPSDAQRRFLHDQQKELFPAFRDKDDKKGRRPHKVYLGQGWNLERTLASPSGHYAALELSKAATGERKPVVPKVVTESGYVETADTRSKVGDKQAETRLVVLNLQTDELFDVDVPADWMGSLMSWAPSLDRLLIRSISPDWHDRDFSIVDLRAKPAAGNLKPFLVDRYHDDAWVGGPAFATTGAWLPDGRGIYFISEADGWARVYTASVEGRLVALTPGEFEVHHAVVDADRGCFYVVTNEGRWGSQRLWRMNLDGSSRTLLTPDPGVYDVTWSPDMLRCAVVRSALNRPGELYTFDPMTGALSGPHTTSTTELFRQYAWIQPEEVTFKASDGAQVRAHIFEPEEFGATSNGAGVVFIHGAGYLQNVIDGWGYYYREYMFHHLLASRGYTVINVDFRASAGYGRKYRTAIYKHMGGRDLDDVIDAARYLVKQHDVGKHQVGAYGGSYGGFLTLMAMFKYPDDIRAGAALRSVTDWAHYNHWYTSRILGIPTEDPEAYRRSSPIYFAEGLEGHLLMLHGLEDDNVMAEDILRLSQRLIELHKEDWELALHPMEGHAYRTGASWTDQMTRTWKLFERVLPNDAPDRKK